ncbi:hypothetical protein K438DRAFT_1962028 [Mycena galopus ATCC 62051]|nr:hypothetical protein K438DRAFT_1962028 [Mycena galopus ATCC 62051]
MIHLFGHDLSLPQRSFIPTTALLWLLWILETSSFVITGPTSAHVGDAVNVTWTYDSVVDSQYNGFDIALEGPDGNPENLGGSATFSYNQGYAIETIPSDLSPGTFNILFVYLPTSGGRELTLASSTVTLVAAGSSLPTQSATGVSVSGSSGPTSSAPPAPPTTSVSASIGLTIGLHAVPVAPVLRVPYNG